MTPSELYQAGKIGEAVTAALEGVKKHPTDTQRRGQLCEMLCIAGDLERADKQLDTIVQQDAQAAVGISLWRQLIRAETARRDVFTQGRSPEFLSEPTPAMQLQLKALVELRAGNEAGAAELLNQAEAARLHVPGVCDDARFDDFRDLDDRTASFLEVLTSTGKYFWVPIERIRSIEFRPPERPRDLLWRRAYMSVSAGPEGEVYLPAIYPGTATDGDDQLKLGRGTDWRESAGGGVFGRGLRMFLIGDEAQGILQLKHIEFDVDEPDDEEAAEPGALG